MGIDLNNGWEDLSRHVGHTLEVGQYGEDGDNLAIECMDCCEVLIDFDAPSPEERAAREQTKREIAEIFREDHEKRMPDWVKDADPLAEPCKVCGATAYTVVDNEARCPFHLDEIPF